MNVNEISLEFKQLHRKFIIDFGLPVQVVHEPYFSERLPLLEEEYGAQTKYLILSELLRDRFGSSPSKFMEYSHSLADKIISTVTNSSAYKQDFLRQLPTKQEVEQYTTSIKDKVTVGKKLYTQEQDGGLFVSYDMKKANFQLMKYICPAVVFDCDTYADFVRVFTDIDYFVAAKGLRQAVFGKINPKEVSQAEFIESCKLLNHLVDTLPNGYEPYSLNNDEVIFKFNGSEDEFKKERVGGIYYDGINFRVERFRLHSRKFKLATSDTDLVVFEKEDIFKPDKRKLFCCPATYYPQVYKLLHGLEIKPDDLVFYSDHELARFLNPLKLVK